MEDANERDQVVIIASLGPIGCSVKTVDINFTNSGFFFQHVNAGIHQGLMFMKQRDPQAVVCLVSYWNNLESRMPVI